MALWFVAEEGRGTALVAYVYGPYNSVSAYQAAFPALVDATVGNKNGYTSQAAAQAEANFLNTGSASTPTQYSSTGPPSNINTSPSAVAARDKAAGGTVAGNPLDIFKGLNLGALILRVGEVVLGIVLVGIALNAVLKNPVGKAASVTPVGKAAKVL